MNIGYQFDNGLRIDISGTNIFDNKYRAFQGMPVIGRRMIAKANTPFNSIYFFKKGDGIFSSPFFLI